MKTYERAIDRSLVPYRNQDSWIPCSHKLRSNIDEILQLKSQYVCAEGAVVESAVVDRRCVRNQINGR